MKYVPAQLSNAKAAAAALVEFLSSDDVKVPGHALESVMSGKSMLRAIASESLVLCQAEADPPVKDDEI